MISRNELCDSLPWAVRSVWRSIDCNKGWYPIIQRLDQRLREISPDYEVIRVKEKFGGLRYYASTGSGVDHGEIRELIAEAELESLETCEWCGAFGTSHAGGWIKTLCDSCDLLIAQQRSKYDPSFDPDTIPYVGR